MQNTVLHYYLLYYSPFSLPSNPIYKNYAHYSFHILMTVLHPTNLKMCYDVLKILGILLKRDCLLGVVLGGIISSEEYGGGHNTAEF